MRVKKAERKPVHLLGCSSIAFRTDQNLTGFGKIAQPGSDIYNLPGYAMHPFFGVHVCRESQACFDAAVHEKRSSDYSFVFRAHPFQKIANLRRSVDSSYRIIFVGLWYSEDCQYAVSRKPLEEPLIFGYNIPNTIKYYIDLSFLQYLELWFYCLNGCRNNVILNLAARHPITNECFAFRFWFNLNVHKTSFMQNRFKRLYR